MTLWIRPEKRGKKVPMVFQHIPATGPDGFWMGSLDDESRQPVHQIWLSEFWMGETPVTNAQYSGSSFFADRPVGNVFWSSAVEFCGKLTEQLPRQLLKEGWTAQLPTEAQWEYACRAGTDTEYYSGNGSGALDAVGWYSANAEGSSQPVKGKAESHPWGLHSMHGNVLEWCADVWHDCAYSQPKRGVIDPVHREHEDANSPHVARGGSHFDLANWCSSACRTPEFGLSLSGYQGFRVVLVSGPASKSP
jgi:formylglycine-generating enzyme required for sulfatase activity